MDSQTLKIPRQRIGVLIGTQGEIKKILEKKGKTRIGIDSKTGEVEVEAGKDAIGFLKTIEAVKAIGRGFAPEKAFKLFEDDYMLDIIELSDLGRSGKGLKNVRGRIIGTHGRARQKIEEETRSLISVFGKTVANAYLYTVLWDTMNRSRKINNAIINHLRAQKSRILWAN